MGAASNEGGAAHSKRTVILERQDALVHGPTLRLSVQCGRCMKRRIETGVPQRAFGAASDFDSSDLHSHIVSYLQRQISSKRSGTSPRNWVAGGTSCRRVSPCVDWSENSPGVEWSSDSGQTNM